MVDPRLALTVFAVLVGVTAALLWPRKGLLPRLVRLFQLTWRVRMEDALKHLHDLDYRGQTGTLDSMVGALGIRHGRAVALVAQLEALELVQSEGPDLGLTDEGRAEARRVLRSHRLWERYLADRTSVAPVDWHDDAEHKEHTISAGRAEALSASMGHPVYDPHGDPIPTAAGQLPPRTGLTIAALAPGETATIAHLEDEPREVYERLVAAGLAPGARLQLVEATSERVQLVVDGAEHVLPPVVAANITVARVATEGPEAEVARTSLADLRSGESGVVQEIAPACPGPQRRRLLDLGLVPGTVVRAELRGPIAGPVAYEIRGALIALRREQAAMVRVERSEHATSAEVA